MTLCDTGLYTLSEGWPIVNKGEQVKLILLIILISSDRLRTSMAAVEKRIELMRIISNMSLTCLPLLTIGQPSGFGAIVQWFETLLNGLKLDQSCIKGQVEPI